MYYSIALGGKWQPLGHGWCSSSFVNIIQHGSRVTRHKRCKNWVSTVAKDAIGCPKDTAHLRAAPQPPSKVCRAADPTTSISLTPPASNSGSGQLSEDLPCLTCPTNILEIVALFSSTKCALFLALFITSFLALFCALVLRLVHSVQCLAGVLACI